MLSLSEWSLDDSPAMPSPPHEIPLALFRECPRLVPALLRDLLNVELPRFDEVRVEEAEAARRATEQQLEEVVSSVSWRLTKPLRALKRLRRSNG